MEKGRIEFDDPTFRPKPLPYGERATDAAKCSNCGHYQDEHDVRHGCCHTIELIGPFGGVFCRCMKTEF